jgi:hypothetical protein
VEITESPANLNLPNFGGHVANTLDIAILNAGAKRAAIVFALVFTFLQ